MISSILSRFVLLLFGTLYPAYSSYKAIRSKNAKEYVKWMMYWVVYAIFTSAETFTDFFFSFWFPFYYELKIIFVIYLLSPTTRGSSVLYRKFVHPLLVEKEQEIDGCVSRAMEQGYNRVIDVGAKGLEYAVSTMLNTAIRGGGELVNQIRKSYSLNDINDQRLRCIEGRDDVDDVAEEDRTKISKRSQLESHFRELVMEHVPQDEQDNALSEIPSLVDVFFTNSRKRPSHSSMEINTRDQLLRTGSMGPTTRLRSRPLAKKTSSTEDDSGCSSTELYGSQCESPYPIPQSGAFIPSFVKPEHRYLFADFTPQQLRIFFNNANQSPVVSQTELMPSPGQLLKSILMKDSDRSTATVEAVSEAEFPPVKSLPSEEPKYKEIIAVDAGTPVKCLFSNESKPETKSGTEEMTPGGLKDKDVAEEGKEIIPRDDSSRCGKYNKRPAPVPPNYDSLSSGEADNEFCTPQSSPLSTRRSSSTALKSTSEEGSGDFQLAVEGPEDFQTSKEGSQSPKDESKDSIELKSSGDSEVLKEALANPQTAKVTKEEKSSKKEKGKGRTSDSHISKMLHLPRIQFPFWKEKGGKESPEPTSGMSRNSSHTSLTSKDSFISLKGDDVVDSDSIGENLVGSYATLPKSRRSIKRKE